MPYDPRPLDNSAITLPPELEALVEMLARNNHELWAKSRIAEGWRFGPTQDGEKKATPLLVPYEDLTESEKDYDRQDSIETLKTVLALGGVIQMPNPAAANSTALPADLQSAWSTHSPRRLTLDQYRDLAGRAYKAAEYLLACDIAAEGLLNWPKDLELRRTRAQSLARSGTTGQASVILTELQNEGHDDEEILSTLARTRKDVWLRTGDPTDLRKAFDAYEMAHGGERERYWSAINCATLAFAMGDNATATRYAEEVETVCAGRMAQHDPDVYWLTATRAEAALVNQNEPTALAFYEQAARAGADQPGNRLSTWRNAKIILRYLAPELTPAVKKALNVPSVALLDADCGAARDYTEAVQIAIRDAVKAKLRQRNVAIGYSPGSAGAGILFAECLLDLRASAHLVLSCSEEHFVDESIRPAGETWLARFNALRCRVEVTTASHERLDLGSIGWDYSTDVLRGLASMRAANIESDLVRFEVVEIEQPEGMVTVDENNSDSVIRIAVARDSSRTVARSCPHPASSLKAEVCAMIFGDAYHFSQLTEAQMPSFIRDFMGIVAATALSYKQGILFQNTWGDGLFFVFHKMYDAGRFALKLADQIAKLDRKASGLPEHLNLRIGLHAGPVYRFRDALTERMNFIGTHVNRTARIEPVTQPGRVYASDAFAALATLEVPGEFGFDYVGRIPLAKNFGHFPMYDMRRI